VPSHSGPRRRGPGRKPKEKPPEFEEPRFSAIFERLRLEVCRPKNLNTLQDAWKLYNAFQLQRVELPSVLPGSKVRQLQCRIEFCDALEKKGDGTAIRARVQRRFELAHLAAEYRKAKEEVQNGGRSDNVNETFKRELFPERDPTERCTIWEYYRQVGEPLLQMVERYGYGALVYPGLNITEKRFVFVISFLIADLCAQDFSLQRLLRGSIGDFMDYIEACHPGLRGMVQNISYILPRLIRSGLPTGGLATDGIRFEQLTQFNDNGFNLLFPLPHGIEDEDLEPPGPITDTSSWPSCDFSNHADCSPLNRPADSPFGQALPNDGQSERISTPSRPFSNDWATLDELFDGAREAGSEIQSHSSPGMLTEAQSPVPAKWPPSGGADDLLSLDPSELSVA
jgi:hypothetical protein